MKIVSILEKNIECIYIRDAIDSLELPNLIALDIANEHDYQIDYIYLSKSILDIKDEC